MSSDSRRAGFSLRRASARLALFALLTSCAPTPTRTLRVCSDPNNLPFSNERQQGFENRVAEIIAKSLQITQREA
jgi:mxaJ protein